MRNDDRNAFPKTFVTNVQKVTTAVVPHFRVPIYLSIVQKQTFETDLIFFFPSISEVIKEIDYTLG